MINKGSSGGSTAFVIFLVLLLVGALYVLYLSLPKEAIDYVFNENIVDRDELPSKPSYGSSKQFYDNMRFKEERISYRIENECDDKKTAEVQEVFNLLEQETTLEFYESSDAELQIFCSEIERPSNNEGYFVAGEGGPTEVINTTLYGVILSAKISFFREERCEEPKVALHEILHALGFDHNNNPSSILYPTLDCDQELDESIVDDLNRLYSVDSKPDLKITELEASKSGRYLNFEIEVMNQGLQDANDVMLSVYSEDALIKEFDLNSIKLGVRKTLSVENLNMGLFRSSDKVTFVIDKDDDIDEIFENNNQIVLELSE